MANNYLLFSEMVPCESAEERRWFMNQMALSVDADGDQFPPCQHEEAEADTNEVWVYADESGDVERLAEIVCRWQKEFDKREPWTLEYAQTCSRPRIGEFAGGAVFCYQGEATFMNSSAWLQEKLLEAK